MKNRWHTGLSNLEVIGVKAWQFSPVVVILRVSILFHFIKGNVFKLLSKFQTASNYFIDNYIDEIYL